MLGEDDPPVIIIATTADLEPLPTASDGAFFVAKTLPGELPNMTEVGCPSDVVDARENVPLDRDKRHGPENSAAFRGLCAAR